MRYNEYAHPVEPIIKKYCGYYDEFLIIIILDYYSDYRYQSERLVFDKEIKHYNTTIFLL